MCLKQESPHNALRKELFSVNWLKGHDHSYAHERRLSLQNKLICWVNTKFEIAITGAIIENLSFYSDICRFGWPSYTLVVVINVWLCCLTGYVLRRRKK